MRRWLRWGTVLGVAGATSTLVFSCGEDVFFVGIPDAGDAARNDVVFPNEAADDAEASTEDAPSACTPHAFSGPTRWVAPRPWHEDACSPMQVDAFVTACANGSTSACAAFEAQNATCFACAASRESDQTWGAFVVVEGGYFVPNVTGCIANALGDLSDDGCGAARGRLRRCGERACRGCLPITDSTRYQAFEACIARDDVSKICADDLAAYRTKCAAHLDPKPGDPTYPCLGVGLSADALYRSYLRAFCTAEADASTD